MSHFQEVLIRWLFACGNLFNDGKMLRSFTLHTFDMKYIYIYIYEKYLSVDSIFFGICGNLAIFTYQEASISRHILRLFNNGAHIKLCHYDQVHIKFIMIESPTKFSKSWGLNRILPFRGAVLRKRGWFLWGWVGGGCSLYIKNKLKSEIFNGKRYL